ncbi:MAG: ribbon-helix-helix protein, CopG family, partial [candidate division NC10 bacterium]
MKTAISIPDPLFRECEKLARDLGISRSQLFSRALAA